MYKRRILSVLLIFVMIFSSLSPTFAVENSTSTVQVKGLNDDWGDNSYPMIEIEPFIWQGTYSLDSSSPQQYKVVRNSDWLPSENITIDITENTDITITYYEKIGLIIDDINEPDGIEAYMVGSTDALGSWTPLASSVVLTKDVRSSHHLLSTSLTMAANESVEFKFVFNPVEGNEWQFSYGDNGNITLTNPNDAETIIDVFLDLNTGAYFTSLDLPVPVSNVSDGANLQISDSINISGSNSNLHYEMTTDGTEPNDPSDGSDVYSGVTLADYEGLTLKFKFVYERGGLVGEALALSVVVEAVVSETLQLESSNPENGGNDVDVDAATFTFNKDITFVDDSEIVITPNINFTSSFENQTLTLTFDDALELYEDYTITFNEDAVLSDQLGNMSVSTSFRTALQSPIVKDGFATFNALHGGETLNVVGSLNGWDNVGVPMTLHENGYFTVEIPLAYGDYEYKFFPVSGSWDNGFADQLNQRTQNGNSLVSVSGWYITSPSFVSKNSTLSLTAEYYDSEGQTTAITPVYTLKEVYVGISISGSDLVVSQNTTVDEIVVQASYNDTVKEMVIEVKEVLYITSTTPSNDAINVTDNHINLTFNEDVVTVDENKISVSPALNYGVSYAGNTLTITFDETYDMLTDYVISLSTGAVSSATLSSEASEFNFKSALLSPIVNGETIQFNAVHDGETLNVVGSMNGWSNIGLAMTKTEDGYFSLDLTLAPGIYEYKYFPVSGSWDNGFTDPQNPSELNGNSLAVVSGLILENDLFIAQGETIPLVTTFVDEAGTPSAVTPTYALQSNYSGVSIVNNQLVITNDAYTGEIVLSVTHGEFTNDYTIEVLETLNEYVINYYRFDENYNGFDVWAWYDNQNGSAYAFTNGVVDDFIQTSIKTTENHLNLIPRKSDWSLQETTYRMENDGDGYTEIWLIEGDTNVYTSRAEANIDQKVISATFDDQSKINVRVSHELGDSASTFVLKDASDQIIPTTAAKVDDYNLTLTVSDMEAIDVRNLYTVSGTGFAEETVIMRRVLDDSQYFYSQDDLGVEYTASHTRFKVWAPTAKKVSVSLYEDAGVYTDGVVTDHSGGLLYEMTRADNGVWSLDQSGDLLNKYYMYKVEFEDGTINYAVDPYVKATSANGQRGVIINFDLTDPNQWASDSKPLLVDESDMVLYELHVRDFSIDDESDMINKGKYKAFTETSTTYNGQKTGVDHLKELGVTHIHLLPVYDFKTVDELEVDNPDSDKPKFNWGYDPQNFNVPEGSYSSDPTNPYARITEFKEMVQSLHEQDLRVVMDVVYNHTFSIEDGPFNKIVPGYFYRTNDKGNFTNGSGCGNEVATERPMVRKYIKDSVKYWADEYNVDGFRFDLMGLIDLQTMEEITYELKHEIDPSIIVYGEPWTAGSHAIYGGISTTKGTQKDKGFAVFNDNVRGAIKGGSDDTSTGFATGNLDSIAGVVTGITGAADFTNNPMESIVYVTAHDNLVLWDKILKTQGIGAADPYATLTESNIFDNETVKRSVLANGIVLTSQSVPFIHAGSEMLRSKQGDHNSYKSSDDINKINWEYKADFEPVFDYYSGLIELRKAHPAFTMETHNEISTNMSVFKQDDGVVAYQLKNYANNDSWENIVVIYNGNESNRTVTLPSNNTWHVVVDNDEAGTEILNTVSGDQVTLNGLSIMVLYDNKKADYIPVESSIITTSNVYNLEAGDTENTVAYVLDQASNIMSDAVIVYAVEDESIATISNGVISAIGDGQTIITLTSGNVTKELVVRVGTKVLTRIEIEGSNSVYQTKTISLMAKCFDQFDELMINQTIEWTSADNSIASVSLGTVTGNDVGSTRVTATVDGISTYHDLTVEAYEMKTVMIYYSRDDENYDNWDMWVWDTGEQDGATSPQNPVTINNKVYLPFQVNVSPTSSRIGMIIRRPDWSEKDPGMDRFIDISEKSNYTKVFSYSGVEAFTYVKAIEGPELSGGSASIFFRDEDLFKSGQMEDVTNVSLVFNGQTYDMTYDVLNELYQYDFDQIPEGDNLYYFMVTKDGETTRVLDVYNDNIKDEMSLLTYTKPNLDITASFSNAVVSEHEGTVLSVEITSDSEVGLSNIYLNLSEIGGPSEVSMDTELRAITIVPTGVGNKTIPITIIDEFGNTHQSSVSLQVTDNDGEWDEAIIYFMVTDRFNDGDTDNNYDVNKDHLEAYHGGDFQGIIDKLDYLADLGVNTIWITPIVDNIDFNQGAAFGGTQYGYHGYWAKDFTKLDEHLGDIETFKSLIDQGHDRGIKIMVDVVVNHVGYGMDSNDDLLETEKLPTAEERAVFDGMLRQAPGHDALTQELAGLPDFITEEAAVREQLIAWQTDWLERARTDRGDTIDYFRVDTVKHVDHQAWQALKNELVKEEADFKMIGEYYDGSLDNTGGYLGSDQMDSLLDFNFKWKAKLFVEGQLSLVESELVERNEKINENVTLGQFLSSHDEDGFLTRLDGSEAELMEKAMLAASLQMTSKGQVVVYYGEEIGLSGKNAGDMSQGQFSENRYDMVFDSDDLYHQTILEHYKTMLNIRADYTEFFSKGGRETVYVSDQDQVSFFKRDYEDEAIFVGLNTGDEDYEMTFSINDDEGILYTDVYSNINYYVSSDNELTVTIPKASSGGTTILVRSAVQPNMINSIEAVSEIAVLYKTSEENMLSKLSSVTTITDVSGRQYEVALTWTVSHYDAKKPGNYTATGTFALPVNIIQTNPITRLNVETTVTVYKKPSNSKTIYVNLDKTRIELEYGNEADESMKTYDLTETIAGNGKKDVIWTSSDASVATVDQNGVVTAVKAGSAVITVETVTGKKSAYCTVNVYLVGEEETPLGSVTIDKPYIGGYPDGNFKPDQLITRAEVATVFASLFSNAHPESVKVYSDVKETHWAYDSIQLISSLGLFDGYKDGSFKPDAPIKRAEIAAVFSNYWKILKHEKDLSEVDVKDIKDHWAKEAIYMLYNTEIVSGFGDGSFRPDDETTRAQLVVMVNKLLNRKSKKSNKKVFGDIDGHWASDFIEAACSPMTD